MKLHRLAIAAAALAVVLTACSTAAGGGSSDAPAEADATVTAADMAFQPGTVTVTAGADTLTIALVNNDAMPHNIAIYSDDSKAEKLFEGEMVTDGTIVYDIGELAPGEYFFDCSLHPDMTGTLVVEG
jgi:plastocyanin